MANNGYPPHPLENFYMENGRGYGNFLKGHYVMPCDATERERLDMMNTLFKTMRADDKSQKKRLTNVPFRERPPTIHGDRSRVLDLGCGTGVWMLEMAEVFKQTEFLGIDINSMGPATLLPNVDIRVPVNYEGPWTLGEQSWDIIHLQQALGSMLAASWGPLYSKVLRHLRPGTGWFESVEIDLEPRCEDGTLRQGRLTQWWDNVRGVYDFIGRPIKYNPHTGDELRRLGFKDVQHKVYQVPVSGWVPESVSLPKHRCGNWYTLAMGSEGESQFGFEAISLAPISRYYTWKTEDIRRLALEAIQQANDPNVHAYNDVHVWWARAPYPNEP